jgi:hypothetical protein
MKKLIAITTVTLLLLSCKKDNTAPAIKNVTVKSAIFTEHKVSGGYFWKPGIIFSGGINATGTVTVEWYLGGLPGAPYYIWKRTMDFKVVENDNGYFEVSSDTAPNDPAVADSSKITAFTISPGNYNVTVKN